MNTYIQDQSYLSESAYLYFLQCSDILPSTLYKMHLYFGSYQDIYNAPISELNKYLSPQILDKYLAAKSKLDIASNYEKLALKGLTYIPHYDSRFPSKLTSIPNPPVALIVNGSLPTPSVPSIAIIGSRRCSNYGRTIAQEYAEYLSCHGIQIISGMAAGIDGIAGRAALKGTTPSFAVLGSGPDICYPRTNQDLFDDLVKNGGIISEYPAGSPALPWHFPLRNRLVSGLVDAIIVIEAAEKSGTLITVDTALDQGRDVYALPGRINDKLSVGCNKLLKQGAGILTSPEEFLTDFCSSNSCKPEYNKFIKEIRINKASTPNHIPSFKSVEDKLIFECLTNSPMPIDQICSIINAKTPMPVANIMIHLTSMTIDGIITNVYGNSYMRS